MNKKGFSLFASLIGLIILLFCIQFALKQYGKSLSTVSALKLGSSENTKAKNGMPKNSLQEGIILKTSILPQLDNLARQQDLFFATKGSYAKDISFLNIAPAPVKQYKYGVSNNSAGWVVWVKKISGTNKFQLFKNVKTKQLCCKEIDTGSCQYLNINAKNCPF